MPRKLLMHRLPFEQVNGTPRAGRPRVPRVVVACADCGGPIERRITDIERSRVHGTVRQFCTQCFARFRIQGARSRGPDTKIRVLDRTHNGRPVWIDHQGYCAIYEPKFSGARQSNSLPKGYHYEHRFVATRKIGRPLRPGEEVHHLNGIKTDNRPANLAVVTKQEHRQIHNAEIARKLAEWEEYRRLYGALGLRSVSAV
jgi:hypothetical protein